LPGAQGDPTHVRHVRLFLVLGFRVEKGGDFKQAAYPSDRCRQKLDLAIQNFVGLSARESKLTGPFCGKIDLDHPKVESRVLELVSESYPVGGGWAIRALQPLTRQAAGRRQQQNHDRRIQSIQTHHLSKTQTGTIKINKDN
jgi:hypothetical protein